MSRTKILVVEDEVVVAMEIRKRLASLGYDVTAAASTGEEALSRAAETKPDLVLMDILLKGEMDGLQAGQKIRSDFAIPVIYLTAHSDEATVQRAKLTEPYGYLVKPFDERALWTTIEVALHKHKMEMERRQLLSNLIVEVTKGEK
jgi:CheY-like chemotaxis protein